MADNVLFYGDNLDILRRYMKDESVDLIYLDPPFKSNQDYNVLFAERDGTQAAAQIKAFEDTWEWNTASAAAFEEAVEAGGRLVQAMIAFRTLLGESDMLAYLSMMAPRLAELHRVLRPTGSLYLHCDPTASHYLKMLLDAVFHPTQFRSEIVWKRTSAHSNPRRWAPVHDVLLLYTKGNDYLWNPVTQDYEADYLETKYRHRDARGPYRLIDLTGSGLRSGDSGRPWQGVDPGKIGRHWGIPRGVVEALVGQEAAGQMTTREKLTVLDEHEYVYWPPKGKRGGAGFPQLKRYLVGGVPVLDVITDVPPINSMAQERLGYPTQKPEALLERILLASSKENDVVLDPFCGCGTTISVAQRLGRRWVGIDITHLAIALIKHRLHDAFGDRVSYRVIGEPVSIPDAQTLAAQDPYQFQWWALGLVGARPFEQKKGADRGIDGRLYFHDEAQGGKTKQIILSVKAGNVTVAHVRDLRGVLDREKAEIGVLICMEEPTKQMRAEAASASFYESPGWRKRYPRLQILTVAELLEGKRIDYPPSQQVNVTFKRAPRAKAREAEQMMLAAEDKAEYRTKGR